MSNLIRREDVENTIQRLCDLCGEYERNNGVMCGACNLDSFIRVLDDIPSAEPERTAKVEWYPHLTKLADGHCECGEDVRDDWKYCPVCGARLEWE